MSGDVDHVAHVVVSGNGESVQALGPPEAVGAIREAIAERDRLARWKDEALQVLGTWDLVGVALGSPSALGESRAETALHAVADLLAERDRLIAEGDRMRDAVHELEAMRARGGDRARMTCPLCPDAVEEVPALRWITDAESVIHRHCGSDDSSDEHNDWVHDLANALWREVGSDAWSAEFVRQSRTNERTDRPTGSPCESGHQAAIWADEWHDTEETTG